MTEPPATPESGQARAIARIERALAELGAELAPPAGWEARVLAARRPRRTFAWLRWAAPALAVAAAIALWLLLRAPPPTAPTLALEVARSGSQMRAAPEEVQLGDTVRLTARGGRRRALWLFHEGELLASCPGAPPCRVVEDHVELTWLTKNLGSYAVIAVYGEADPPKPSGALDADLAAARRAGAELRERHFEIR
ncbi:MAG: hypothetical protein R3B48_23590 [Kofleriaceae bacterium]